MKDKITVLHITARTADVLEAQLRDIETGDTDACFEVLSVVPVGNGHDFYVVCR